MHAARCYHETLLLIKYAVLPGLSTAARMPDAACAFVEADRPQARNTEKLEELLAYLPPDGRFCPTTGSATSRASTAAVGTQRSSTISWWPAGRRERCAGCVAHAAQRRLGALLAAPPGPPRAHPLTRTVCALTLVVLSSSPYADTQHCPYWRTTVTMWVKRSRTLPGQRRIWWFWRIP